MQSKFDVKIFVISLVEDFKRRKRIDEMFSDLKVDFEFVDAVDGREKKAEDFKEYNAKKRMQTHGKHLTGSEMGCFVSHKKVYQKIVDQNIQNALIFEDDIILDSCFFDVVSEIYRMPISFDMIRFLGHPKFERMKLRKIYQFQTGHHLVRYVGLPGGAYATLVTLEGVQKILPSLETTYVAIDNALGRSWEHHCDWYCVKPSLAYVNFDLGSNIGDSRFVKENQMVGLMKLLYPLTRGWFKLKENFCKKYWLIKTLYQDKFKVNSRDRNF